MNIHNLNILFENCKRLKIKTFSQLENFKRLKNCKTNSDLLNALTIAK